MPSMPAAVYTERGRVDVQDVPVPVPGNDEALVEVSHCGVCGTDLHFVFDGYARPGTILGHEWSGIHEGRRVVADPTPGCGECRACRRDRPSVCRKRPPTDHFSFRGAFAKYVTVPVDRLLEIPDPLSTRAAALTEPTAIAIHTVDLSGVEPEDRVLVTGGGPVGLLTTAVLRARGITDITVSEPSPVRRERALAVGAASVVEPGALPTPPMATPVDAPFDLAFECSGSARAAEAALDQLDFAGTLVYVGTGAEPPRVNHNRVIILELTMLGAYNYSAGRFRPALDLLASGDLPVDLLIEPEDVTLDGLQPALERLHRGEIPAKVLVRPEVRS